jgi:hypothetical protein
VGDTEMAQSRLLQVLSLLSQVMYRRLTVRSNFAQHRRKSAFARGYVTVHHVDKPFYPYDLLFFVMLDVSSAECAEA